MTESKLVELGFSEVAPGFWVGSVFALNKLYQQGRQDESGAESSGVRRGEEAANNQVGQH